MIKKRIKSSDIVFIFALLAICVIYLFYLKKFPRFADESFYPTIALRLINGDSLLSDEWHLSQFSSLFLYLPVKLWLMIKGSTDGIVMFLRCVYLAIHTFTATGIYLYFRDNKIWAVAAAMMFYSQSPLNIMNLSYNTLFALFLLLLCFALIKIYASPKPVFYIIAGIAYACACVCNPFFCLVFVFYCAFLLLSLYKNSKLHKKNLILKNKERKKMNRKPYSMPIKKHGEIIFFSKNAFLFTFIGIAITASICLLFFLCTNGSLSGIAANFKNLLTDSEHNVFNSPLVALFNKLKKAASCFNTISFGLFFLPLLLFGSLAFDKKRKTVKHKAVYLSLTFALSVFYLCGVSVASINGESNIHFFSLPFFLFSSVCYILSNNKNKKLFYCFWLPCVISAIIQFLASNLILWPVGWVCAIANVCGTFFVKDVFYEFIEEKEDCKKIIKQIACAVLCCGIILQISYNSISIVYGYTLKNKDELHLIETGPYEDLYLSKKYYGTLELSMQDLDKIKEMSEEDDSVLILSDMTWLYLHIDRPFGTYSAWQLSFEPERLKAYYELNPEKIPKYIYISAVIPRSNYGVSFKEAQYKAAVMKEMFNCTEKKLSRGILLTVIE